jgi:phage FluMu gp28-like protein
LHAEFGDRAQGVDFTNPNKELWAVELKLRMQKAQVPLPLDRELAYQIHSIRKTTTAAKNNVFDAARSEHGHADKFWALALAVWAGRPETSGIVLFEA